MSCSCPLCKSQNKSRLFATNGYDMLACANCEMLFISPYPETEQERFAAVAGNCHKDITVIGPEQYHQARQQYYQDLFPFIKPALPGAESLLDIGCGTGHLLNLAQSCGVKHCQGLELNAKRAAFARANSNCEIAGLPIEQFGSERKFDVITLIDVLSHVYSYDKLFAAVKNLLSEKGKFIIKTGQYTQAVQKNSVFDWEVPDHLHFMGMATPDFIAAKYGMKIISKESISYADELYTRKRFLIKGRSFKRNVIKTILAYTPFAIEYLKQRYIRKFGNNCYSVVLVLENENLIK